MAKSLPRWIGQLSCLSALAWTSGVNAKASKPTPESRLRVEYLDIEGAVNLFKVMEVLSEAQAQLHHHGARERLKLPSKLDVELELNRAGKVARMRLTGDNSEVAQRLAAPLKHINFGKLDTPAQLNFAFVFAN